MANIERGEPDHIRKMTHFIVFPCWVRYTLHRKNERTRETENIIVKKTFLERFPFWQAYRALANKMKLHKAEWG